MQKTPSVRCFFALLTISTFGVATSASAEPTDSDLRDALDTGMAGYHETLDEDQRDEALYAFDDDERFDLRLAPLGLEGLRVDEMTDAQWATLEGLLGYVLSAEGMNKLNKIRSLEVEIAEMEGGLIGFFMDRIRKPGRYFLALFRDTEQATPWGFRFDGHHASINVTSVPGAPLSATPLFLGGQPRVVPSHFERAGLRVLPQEEDLAVAFINHLSNAERESASLLYDEGSAFNRPMSISDDVDLVLPAPQGVDRSALDPGSRARLDQLVDVHLANYQSAIADRYRTGMRGGNGPVTFTYSVGPASDDGHATAGQALYYRIQGGGLSIEFDDTAKAADHIHVVFRHPASDFGRDILAAHLRDHSSAP